MSSNFLSVGMNGVVQVNGTAVANLKNAAFSIKNDNVEEYVCGGTKPKPTGAFGGDESACRNQSGAALDRQHLLTLAQTPGTRL